MPRPTWTGYISFGLVNIPITLYPGEKRTDLHFNLIDNRNKRKVVYERVNEDTGEEVPWNQIVKGYEYDEGNFVLLNDEDFKRAKVEATQVIEIEDFIPSDHLNCMFFEKPYYLVPNKQGEKGYVLLREALKQTKTVGIAKVVIHTRQYLCAIMPRDDALVMNVLRFAQELRKPEEFDLPKGPLKTYKITPKEMEMATQVIESMTSDWKPERYKDDYREALLRWIEKKVRSGKSKSITTAAPEKAQEGGKVIDIMSLLQKSMKQHKKNGKREAA